MRKYMNSRTAWWAVCVIFVSAFSGVAILGGAPWYLAIPLAVAFAVFATMFFGAVDVERDTIPSSKD